MSLTVILVLGLFGLPGQAAATPRDPMLMPAEEVFQDLAVVEGIGAGGENGVPPLPEGEADERFIGQLMRVRPEEVMLTRYIRAYNKKVTDPQARYLARHIMNFSQRYDIDFRLVASIIAVESSFRPDAISSSGAIGLGQLKPDTAKWLGVMDPFNPADNIGGLTRYISYLLTRYRGNLDKALSAYYQGPGTIDRQGITDVCQPYLLKVNVAFDRFRRL